MTRARSLHHRFRVRLAKRSITSWWEATTARAIATRTVQATGTALSRASAHSGVVRFLLPRARRTAMALVQRTLPHAFASRLVIGAPLRTVRLGRPLARRVATRQAFQSPWTTACLAESVGMPTRTMLALSVASCACQQICSDVARLVPSTTLRIASWRTTTATPKCGK